MVDKQIRRWVKNISMNIHNLFVDSLLCVKHPTTLLETPFATKFLKFTKIRVVKKNVLDAVFSTINFPLCHNYIKSINW
jgi:hypothetical protein